MRYRKIGALVLMVCVLCVGGYFVYASTVISIKENVAYKVAYVVDGDTFAVFIGKNVVRVRMLGIDTPETVDKRKKEQCYGKKASDESKKLLVGHSVHLKLNPNREEKDKYNRYLAYVYLDDGTMLNEYLLTNGFAREYTYGTVYMYQKEFRDMETTAKEGKIGLWGACM